MPVVSWGQKEHFKKSRITTVTLWVIKTSFHRDMTDFSQKKTKLTIFISYKCMTFITLGEGDCCLMGLLPEKSAFQYGIINSVSSGPGYSELEGKWTNPPFCPCNLGEHVLTVHGRITLEIRATFIQLSHFANKGIKSRVSHFRLVICSETTQQGKDTAQEANISLYLRSKMIILSLNPNTFRTLVNIYRLREWILTAKLAHFLLHVATAPLLS